MLDIQENNKQLVRDYTARVFNDHQPHLAAKFMAPDVIWHGGSLGSVSGAENLVGMLSAFLEPLPDLYADEQAIVADGDLVWVRYVVTATVRGALMGVASDGTQLRWDAVDVYRIAEGRIVEEWAFDDIATVMAQIGAFTPPWAG